MKKLYFSLLPFLFFIVAHAQILNIPDANFKAKLLGSPNYTSSSATPVYDSSNGNWTVSSFHVIDTNNDGEIQVSEAQTIKYLNLFSCNITSLEGIESFTNLIYLSCRTNQLSSLNVQGLANLQGLNCGYNQLASLNLQGLANLQVLACYQNPITSLNVQGLVNLQTLDCSYNHLSSLNVQG